MNVNIKAKKIVRVDQFSIKSESEANAFREIRRYAGMTQEQAAERLGISRPSVCNIERGKQALSLVILERMANIAGLKVEINITAL